MTDTLQRSAATAPDAPLLHILRVLEDAGYRFITPTPATHALVSSRHRRARPGSLRDVFGWSQAFRPGDIDGGLLRALEAAEAVRSDGDGLLRSIVRVASVDDRLYLHSAPSDDPDAVFLGPDSYRFVRLLKSVLAGHAPARRALDIGTGAGVGALTLASIFPQAEVWAGDVNPSALGFMWINARHAGIAVRTALAPGLSGVEGQFDVIVANPPYIAGNGGRTYRDGGGELGAELALDWTRASLTRLSPGGRMVLYTGSAIVDGVDPIHRALTGMARQTGCDLTYDELDPDVFGGTLKQSAYRTVDRIAAVGAVLTAPARPGETRVGGSA